jgi:4'-phosphopantetheinyl transferase EntD
MTVAAIRAWLPSNVHVAIERIDAPDLEARAARAAIRMYAERVVPTRRLEYLAGRLAASAALRSAGADQSGVGRQDRVPRWPTGFCGSISHSSGLAVAIAARSEHWRALGIDIEACVAGQRARVLRKAMGDDEFAAAGSSTDPWVWTRAWAAKEAAYKCLSALGAHGSELDFAALLPCWTSAGKGELHARERGVACRLELRWCIENDLMWVIAGMTAQR